MESTDCGTKWYENVLHVAKYKAPTVLNNFSAEHGGAIKNTERKLLT